MTARSRSVVVVVVVDTGSGRGRGHGRPVAALVGVTVDTLMVLAMVVATVIDDVVGGIGRVRGEALRAGGLVRVLVLIWNEGETPCLRASGGCLGVVALFLLPPIFVSSLGKGKRRRGMSYLGLVLTP